MYMYVKLSILSRYLDLSTICSLSLSSSHDIITITITIRYRSYRSTCHPFGNTKLETKTKTKSKTKTSVALQQSTID